MGCKARILTLLRNETSIDTFCIFDAPTISWVTNNYLSLIMEDFDKFVAELESAEQPTCNILNPEDCEACGS
jgi:hypothetical protein